MTLVTCRVNKIRGVCRGQKQTFNIKLYIEVFQSLNLMSHENVQYLKYFSISRFVWTKFKLLIIRCIYSDARAREIHRKDITELSSLTLVSALNSQSPAGDRISDFSSRSASPGDWGRDLGAVTERPRPRGTRLTWDTGGQSLSSGAHLICDQWNQSDRPHQ